MNQNPVWKIESTAQLSKRRNLSEGIGHPGKGRVRSQH